MRGAGGEVRIHLLRGRVQVHYAAGNGWFRVAGYGASIKDARRRPLLFSDRNLIGAIRVGPFNRAAPLAGTTGHQGRRGAAVHPRRRGLRDGRWRARARAPRNGPPTEQRHMTMTKNTMRMAAHIPAEPGWRALRMKLDGLGRRAEVPGHPGRIHVLTTKIAAWGLAVPPPMSFAGIPIPGLLGREGVTVHPLSDAGEVLDAPRGFLGYARPGETNHAALDRIQGPAAAAERRAPKVRAG